MEEYTGAVRRSIDGGIYWSSEDGVREYTGAVRRSIDGGIYWSSEEVNRWRNILEQ